MRSSTGTAAWITLAALQFASLAVGQLSDAPSVQNFVRRFSGAAVVVGNYAYLDGGEVIQMDGGSFSTARIVNSTLSLDLTKSWALKDAVFKSTPKGVSPSKGNAGAWANREGTALYVWGGKSPYAINLTTPALYKFTVDGKGGGSWDIERPQNPNLFAGLLPTEGMAVTTVNNTMYGIGGVASQWSTPKFGGVDQVIPGMIMFNMDTRGWTNITGTESPVTTLMGGRIEYLPSFGPQGLVMVMGGHAPRADVSPTIENSRLNDFETLTFFDPVTFKKHTQTATGDVPVFPRAGFCTSSFQNKQGGQEIFVFGGENTLTKVRYNDAYVLSLPGFVWTKVPSAPFGGRAFMACTAVGKRQVLTVGGLEFNDPGKDDAPMGLLMYDMAAMRWKDSYDAALSDYERPDVISAFYNNGSLAKVQWSSKEVQSLFTTGNTGGGSQGGSGAGSGNSTSDSTQQTKDLGPTSPATIAGSVVGAIIALAAISVLTTFLVRRCRRRRQGNAGIEFSAPEQPDIAEMAAAQGRMYSGDHRSVLPPGYQAQPKYGPGTAVVEADTFAYAEVDGTSRFSAPPGVRTDRTSHVAELDGGVAPQK